MSVIWYRCGYKYQLVSDYTTYVNVAPKWVIKNEYLSLDTEGKLSIRAGYAWDGPSGPTWDSKNSMRGSLVHDALYQLMREELLSPHFRKKADKELYRICVEDGMWRWRAHLWYLAVSKLAGPAASPTNNREACSAP
jgi:hypothetical protein